MYTSTEFFEYLLLSDPNSSIDDSASAPGLQLRKLHATDCCLKEAGLLQVQSTLLAFWVDYVQKSPNADQFLHCIPDALWKPEFLRRGILVSVWPKSMNIP